MPWAVGRVEGQQYSSQLPHGTQGALCQPSSQSGPQHPVALRQESIFNYGFRKSSCTDSTLYIHISVYAYMPHQCIFSVS